MVLFGVVITWVGAKRRRRLRRLRRDAGILRAVHAVTPDLRATQSTTERVVDDVDEVSGWLGVKDSKGMKR